MSSLLAALQTTSRIGEPNAVAMLERIHADRADAGVRGAAAARFIEGLSWRNQVRHLVDSISDLL